MLGGRRNKIVIATLRENLKRVERLLIKIYKSCA